MNQLQIDYQLRAIYPVVTVGQKFVLAGKEYTYKGTDIIADQLDDLSRGFGDIIDVRNTRAMLSNPIGYVPPPFVLDPSIKAALSGNIAGAIGGEIGNALRTEIAGGALGGGLKVSTGDYTYFSSDVSIDGEIVAGKITSMGRIDGEGVSAGLQGFVSMLGGLSIGIPAAVPLQINCAGPITSFTSIDAPLGLFGVSSSILGFDVLNTLIFDTHIHPAPLGVTGPSTTQFIAV